MFIQILKIEELNENTINSLHIIITIYLSVLYYLGISEIPKHFLSKILIDENKIMKKIIYKSLIIIPIINIFFVYYINKKKDIK